MKKQAVYITAILAIFFILISGCTGKNAKTAKAEYVFTTIEKGSIEKTVSSSGTDLTVNWTITIKSPFVAKNLNAYMYVFCMNDIPHWR